MFGLDDAALAMLVSGAISTAGSLYTNSKNRQLQNNANLANLQIARENNQTQVDMANSAHQREVRDLRAAGLNPILSAGGSGASTPTLTSANVQASHLDNSMEGLANSAKGVARYLSQEYKNQLQLQQEQAHLTRANKAEALSRQYMNTSQASLMDAEIQRQTSRIGAEIKRDQLELGNEISRSLMERAAMKYEYGIEPYVNDDGEWAVKYHSRDAFGRALNLAREGLRSDLKVRANQNWRNNLSSFLPIGGALNSTVNSAQRVRSLVR